MIVNAADAGRRCSVGGTWGAIGSSRSMTPRFMSRIAEVAVAIFVMENRGHTISAEAVLPVAMSAIPIPTASRIPSASTIATAIPGASFPAVSRSRPVRLDVVTYGAEGIGWEGARAVGAHVGGWLLRFVRDDPVGRWRPCLGRVADGVVPAATGVDRTDEGVGHVEQFVRDAHRRYRPIVMRSRQAVQRVGWRR